MWVHHDCRQRLLDGERPPGVEVRGVPDHQLREIVVLCEDKLGCLAPALKSLRRISAADRRKAREVEFRLLRTRIEQQPEVIVVEQLHVAIERLWRQRKTLGRPRDLVTEVNRLRRSGWFRPDPTPDPYADLPFH